MGKIAAKYREQSPEAMTPDEGRAWLGLAVQRLKTQGAKFIRAAANDPNDGREEYLDNRVFWLVEGWDELPGLDEWPAPVFDVPISPKAVTVSGDVTMIPEPVPPGPTAVHSLKMPDPKRG